MEKKKCDAEQLAKKEQVKADRKRKEVEAKKAERELLAEKKRKNAQEEMRKNRAARELAVTKFRQMLVDSYPVEDTDLNEVEHPLPELLPQKLPIPQPAGTPYFSSRLTKKFTHVYDFLHRFSKWLNIAGFASADLFEALLWSETLRRCLPRCSLHSCGKVRRGKSMMVAYPSQRVRPTLQICQDPSHMDLSLKGCNGFCSAV